MAPALHPARREVHPLVARPTAGPVPVGRGLRPPPPDLREMLDLNFGHRSVAPDLRELLDLNFRHFSSSFEQKNGRSFRSAHFQMFSLNPKD